MTNAQTQAARYARILERSRQANEVRGYIPKGIISSRTRLFGYARDAAIEAGLSKEEFESLLNEEVKKVRNG